MDGFKLNIELPMPAERPDRVELCDSCHMKHTEHDECWTGMLPAGELPLPTLDKTLTGRELIDEKPVKSLPEKQDNPLTRLFKAAKKLAKGKKRNG